jgi:hypothetical protein
MSHSHRYTDDHGPGLRRHGSQARAEPHGNSETAQANTDTQAHTPLQALTQIPNTLFPKLRLSGALNVIPTLLSVRF